ncbi:hypothetical protein [Brevibacterium sp. UCMA 11754]|uniref:hypothetical protein n=1 Tax=Brevibacterium sp. UCMA 11754 TaxID=2749198 RepID=UPI001F336C68
MCHPLALATGDPRPLVGIRRIGQILVLAEFLGDGLFEVLRLETALTVSSSDLIALFLARSTMLWIMAPEAKSAKWRTSLAPSA